MMNDDVVTNPTLIMGGTGLKAIRVFHAEADYYGFTRRIYREGVKERLSTAQAAVVLNQLNKYIATGQGVVVSEEALSPFGVPKNWLLEELRNVKGKIHDYTA